MKIKGQKLEGPIIEIVAIPRDNQDVIFKAKSVLNWDDFDKLCPIPKPPKKFVRNVGWQEDTEDQGYKNSLKNYATMKMDWLIIESLRATEDLEWEKVKYNEPSTWHLYEQELKEAGFNQFEINRINGAVLVANSLDEKKMEEARKRFLAGQEQTRNDSSTQITEQVNTPSGEHVNGSVSVLRK